jgi:3'-phosphoadenosine 5'-phosphosulfate sulfotransferase (PAPS reductase)/FAD synthetase
MRQKLTVGDIWHIGPKEIETLSERRVVLSMSGGKDSTACALLLEKHGVPFERIFMDTGWEHPAIYDYIKTVLEPRFGSVTRIKSKKFPNGMADLVRYKNMFPSRLLRFCTQELKIFPFEEWVKAQDDEVVSVVGIRRQESQARSEAKRWAFNEALDIEIFRPIVDHSFDDIIEMHRQADIPPNPLYLQGAERVGCYPCIFARKSEVDQVARTWPGRIDEIAELEEELTQKAKQRSDDKKSVSQVTFFHGRGGAGATGIRQVASWAKTAFGGRQLKLFDLSAQDGCSRWGMCESPLADSELVKIRETSRSEDQNKHRRT